MNLPQRGEVWWADLGDPVGSAPGYRRPVVVIQGDAFNRSAVRTVVCVPVTSNMTWARSPGNVELEPGQSGLSRPSVANVSQIVSLDRSVLTERVGVLRASTLELVLGGVDIVLGR